jgi:ketosteroid isomerase-like protein
MSAEKNIALIQKIYAAFMQGDVATIVEYVSDDVDWGIEARGSSVPWYGTGNGKDFVVKFFQSLAQAEDFSRFEPSGFLASDSAVSCLVSYESTIKKNGRTQSLNAIHHFTIKNGRISRWRGFEDTALTAANWA